MFSILMTTESSRGTVIGFPLIGSNSCPGQIGYINVLVKALEPDVYINHDPSGRTAWPGESIVPFSPAAARFPTLGIGRFLM